ncbi:MAG: hypothetical protein KDB73_10925 [Planctomycetes bacterium]|nr:hypothetical protein [Planctomycetota bacterium]
MITDTTRSDVDGLVDEITTRIIIVQSPVRADGLSAADYPEARRRAIGRTCRAIADAVEDDAQYALPGGRPPERGLTEAAEAMLRSATAHAAGPVRLYAVDMGGRLLAQLDVAGDAPAATD